MLNHFADSEPASERLMLIDFGHPLYDPKEYGYLEARIIRRAMRDVATESHHTYNDGANATGFRWATWQNAHKNALYVEDFMVRAMFSLRGAEQVYTPNVEFRDKRAIEYRDAELMHDTFTKLRRKIRKQNEIYGDPKTFADWAVRVAAALGITQFARYPHADNRANRSLDQVLKEFKANDVAWVADKLMRDAREEYK